MFYKLPATPYWTLVVIEVMNWIGGGATNQLLASGVQKPYSSRMTAEWGEGVGLMQSLLNNNNDVILRSK